MKEFTIGKNDAGQRLDRWLAKTLPLLPAPLAQKYIRLKRVKVNGKGSKRDVRLAVGDLLQLYINDEFFDRPTPENAFLSLYQPKLNILYEDEHILLVDKRPGLVVHPDESERVNTLLTHIQAYLYQKKEWSPYWENSFAPALCNRIDRNTGGIVIAAKTAEGLRVMNQKIKDRELEKRYLCVIHGTMPQREGKLEGYLWKDEVKKQVYVRGRPEPGAKTAVTLYKTLAVKNGLSLVECDLITGRTHQIRVHMKHIGHVLFNDERYGGHEILKGTHFSKYKQFVNNCFDTCPRQALHAMTLGFVHPVTGEEMNFTSELPDDMAQLIEKWRGYISNRELE